MVELLALILDAALGWPAWLYARIGHPVGAFARIIAACERRWNRRGLGDGRRRMGGVATLLILLLAATLGGWLIQSALHRLMGAWAWAGIALAAWPALAQRSLFDHVLPVVKALKTGDLPTARQAVGHIVGRDTASLDEAGVARAAIESLAESFCDGVVAPLFWLVVGGLPGIWAYKAVNTADSMIGHREEPFAAFGWAAARFDDLLNLAPARLSAILLCVAGPGAGASFAAIMLFTPRPMPGGQRRRWRARWASALPGRFNMMAFAMTRHGSGATAGKRHPPRPAPRSRFMFAPASCSGWRPR